jgi:dCMP deaminase
MPLIFKDGVPENIHHLNVREVAEVDGGPVVDMDRPPLYEVYMRMAEELAKRSTCARLKVGTVITDKSLQNVVSIGYNGNARGFPNECDTTEAGKCGCIHSEMNALVKAPGQMPEKVAFVTASPCVMCAKLVVQSNVTHLFYRERYRVPSGLEILEKGGVHAVHYHRWKDHWRD